MSVTFTNTLVPSTGDRDDLNLSNHNAGDLLAFLGLPSDELYGHHPASDVAARCRRALWLEMEKRDPAIEPTDEIGAGGCQVINCGRPAGYLQGRARQLLELCERGLQGEISWA